MIHHILKDVNDICPYCGSELIKEEFTHYSDHNYKMLTFKCGKKVLKRTNEYHNSKPIKTLEDY
jgi:hypothetical protein